PHPSAHDSPSLHDALPIFTQRVLERVPADKLSWKPHRKSMSLGQLALHVATIPGSLSKLAQLEEFDASQANFDPPAPNDTEEIQDRKSTRLNSSHVSISYA